MKITPSRLLSLLAAAAGFSSAGLPLVPAATPARVVEMKAVPYRITRGDTLSVAVVGEDIPAAQKRVEAIGTINLTYIGDVRLAGLTIREAQELIQQTYRENRILRNPTVNVVIENYSPRIVRISGKVNSPGPINIPADVEMTIIDLISKANGLTETGNAKEVRVSRTQPDGSTKYFRLNIDAALKAKGSANSGDARFVVEPDDIVHVPEKLI